MFCKVQRHIFVPSSGLDETNIKGAFYPGGPLAPLYPIVIIFTSIIIIFHQNFTGKILVCFIQAMQTSPEFYEATRIIFVCKENKWQLYSTILLLQVTVVLHYRTYAWVCIFLLVNKVQRMRVLNTISWPIRSYFMRWLIRTTSLVQIHMITN